MNNIDNYKLLLSTIFNSDDSKRKTNSVVCVYDMLEHERLVALFNNTNSCASFFNTSIGAIQKNLQRDTLRCGRYRLERVEIK